VKPTSDPKVFVNKTTPLPATSFASRDALEFHMKLPGYVPTPLLSVAGLAARLGIGAVLIKDESDEENLESLDNLVFEEDEIRKIDSILGV
jgi:hypothetical protein